MKLFTYKPCLLMVAALILAGCTQEAPDSAGAESSSHHDHAEMSMSSGEPVKGASLHQLDAPWTDHTGGQVSLADFAGQTVVLAMVYTHCDYACPRIITDMRRIRDRLPGNRDDVAFVLASIDPQRDTVERLRQFGKETGLISEGWVLMQAPESTIRELSAVLGVQYQRISETDFAHSNIITVLDDSGIIVHQQIGMGESVDATVAAIESHSQATHTGTGSRP